MFQLSPGIIIGLCREVKQTQFIFQILLILNHRSFLCSFSRHAKTHASMVLVIWLNENVLHLQTGQDFRLIHAVMQVTRISAIFERFA